LAGEPNQSLSFHRYQEGGAIGGPIVHKKLFSFGPPSNAPIPGL
jgi:hypothetical protein